ncbi:MAG: type II secretion system protein [Dehalococcoidia bacterium]|nr:type II secretion system protein [Dehalococcoidia bacterium]
MRSLMQKAYRGQGGFTLVELLVVVAILGVIAAVVVLNVGGFMGSGQTDAANTEAHQVQTAIIAYMAYNHSSTAPGTTVSAATPGIADDYLVDPGKLQATYTYDTDGAITAAVATTGGKWDGCVFVNGQWTC